MKEAKVHNIGFDGPIGSPNEMKRLVYYNRKHEWMTKTEFDAAYPDGDFYTHPTAEWLASRFELVSVGSSQLSPHVPQTMEETQQYVEKLMKLNASYCEGCGHCTFVCPARIDLRGSVLRAKSMLRTE